MRSNSDSLSSEDKDELELLDLIDEMKIEMVEKCEDVALTGAPKYIIGKCYLVLTGLSKCHNLNSVLGYKRLAW